MAINKNEINIKINADNSEAKRNINATGDSLKQLGVNAGSTIGNIDKLTISEKQLASQTQANNGAINTFAGNIAGTNDSIDSLAKSLQLFTENKANIEKTFRAMAMILDLKGFNQTADSLRMVNEQFINISQSSLDATKNVSSFIDAFTTLEGGTSLTVKSLEVAAASIAGLFVYNLGKNILSKSPEVSLAISNIFNNISITNAGKSLFGAMFKDFKASDINLSSITGTLKEAFGKTFEDIGGVISKSGSIFSGVFNSLSSTIKGLSKLFTHFSEEVFGATFKLSTLLETASLAGNGLVVLGGALAGMDNGLVKFIGYLSLAASVLLTGFAAAISYAFTAAGGAIMHLGTIMLDTMSEWEAVTKKAQVATVNFQYTLEGFISAFGSGSVGTLQSWEEQIAKIADATTLSTQELQKSATEIVSAGYGLGLTEKQMKNLLQIIPEYTKAGEDAFDTTTSFLQALNGNSQSVLRYGVHLGDAAVNHSKYAKSLGLDIGSLTDLEKVQLRFSTLLEQANPIIGRAAIQLITVEGANKRLENSMTRLQAIMGSTNYIFVAMRVIAAQLVDKLLQIPTPVLDFASSLYEVLGITLTVTGAIFKYSLALLGLASAYKYTSLAIKEFTLLQMGLDLVFGGIAKSLNSMSPLVNITVKNVTSLGDVFKNLAILSQATVVVALTQVWVAISKVGKALMVFLTSPPVLYFSAIAAAVYLVIKALESIEEQTKLFSTAWASFTGVFESTDIGIFKRISQGLASIFSGAILKVIQAATIVVSGFVAGLFSLVSVVEQLGIAFTESLGFLDTFFSNGYDALNTWFPLSDKFRKSNESTSKILGELTGVMATNSDAFFTFSESAYAAKTSSEAVAKALDNMKLKAAVLITPEEISLINATVTGNQAMVISLNETVAKQHLAIAKTLDEKKAATKEIYQAQGEINKFYLDIAKETRLSIVELGIAQQEVIKNLKLPTESITEFKKVFISQIDAINKASKLTLSKDLEDLLKRKNEIQVLANTEQGKKALAELNTQISNIQKKSKLSLTVELKAKLEEIVSSLEGDLKDALDRVKFETPQLKLDFDLTTILGKIELLKDEYAKMVKLGVLTQEEASNKLKKLDDLRYAAMLKNFEDIQKLPIFVEGTPKAKQLEATKNLLPEAKLPGTPNTSGMTSLDVSREQFKWAKNNYDIAIKNLNIEKNATEDIARRQQIEKQKYELQLKYNQAVKDQREIESKAQGAFSPGIAQFANVMTGFSSGLTEALAPITSIMDAANSIVSTIQKLIDFLPQFVTSIANVFNSLNSLPEMLAKSLEGLATSISGFINGFLNNLNTFIPKMIDAILKIVDILPNIIITLMNAIPTIMLAILNKLPDIISSLIASLITSLPKTVVNMLTTIFKVLPNLLINSFRVIITELPEAILKGVIEGLNQIGSMFTDFWDSIFGGGETKVEKSSSSLIQAISASNEYLSGVSQALYGIQEVNSGRKGQNLAGGLTGNEEENRTRTEGFFTRLWKDVIQFFKGLGQGLLSIFNFTKEFFLGLIDTFKSLGKDIISAISSLWEMLQSFPEKLLNALIGLVTGIGGAIKAIWDAGWEFIKGLGNAVVNMGKSLVQAILDVANLVYNSLISPLLDAFKKAFMWVWDNIIAPIGNVLKDGLNGFIKFFTETLPSTFNGLFSGIADFFKGLFNIDWQAMRQGFTTMFSNVVDTVMSPIKGLVNGIFDVLNNLKLPQVDVGFSVLGKGINFTLIPEIDLIPGNLPHFAKGGLVPGQGTGDIFPAMLTPGEFIIPRQDTQNLMDYLKGNKGAPSNNTQNITINLDIKTEQPIDESFIKNKVLPTISRELKRQSLDGKFVLAGGGIR